MTPNTKKSFVELSHARIPEQKKVMEQIEKEAICPFCKENLKRFHKKPIIKEGSDWFLTFNQWPYENTKTHLMAITKKHIEKLSEINSVAWSDLGKLTSWAEKKYKMTSGAIGFRFGNPKKNGASVRHVHVQILNAKITNKSSPLYKPIHFKMG